MFMWNRKINLFYHILEMHFYLNVRMIGKMLTVETFELTREFRKYYPPFSYFSDFEQNVQSTKITVQRFLVCSETQKKAAGKPCQMKFQRNWEYRLIAWPYSRSGISKIPTYHQIWKQQRTLTFFICSLILATKYGNKRFHYN